MHTVAIKILNVEKLFIKLFLYADLLHATTISMEPNSKTFLIDVMFDIKSWISPHLNELHGHRDPHCFKFVLNKDNKSIRYFWNWSTDLWCPEDRAIVILKVCTFICKCIKLYN